MKTRHFITALALLTGALQGQAQVTVFEGARLITGNNVPPIENSVFIVDGTIFTRAGRRGEVPIPAGAVRVNLAGKTVMPAKVDLHGHFGYQHPADGTMAKEYFTRENLIDHLQRLAYFGFSATIGIGDLVDRSDLHGGRTGWGDVPLRLRDEIIPDAALFRTAGPGIAWPDSGAQGHPSRADVPYPVTTVAEAIEAVRDNARMKPEFIKIWVDDRGGTKKKLTPELYLAIIQEAHRLNIPVAAHNVTLADAKLLMRAGVEGWLHLPVRMGEVPDDELLSIIKDRIARNDRPNMWFNPGAGWTGSSRADWDDPLLTDTIPAQQIKEQWGDYLATLTPESVARARQSLKQMGATNALKLKAAGMKIVLGSDTGQTRFFIGWMGQLEMENWVYMGLTPAEAIVAATRDSAAAAHINTGLVAAGKNADFIVLDANPLDNIANTRRINKVYLRGAEVNRAALKAKWQALAPQQTKIATQKTVFENDFVRVVELRVPAGVAEEKHSHDRGVTIALSDYDNELTTYPERTVARRHTAFGEVRWADPVTHEARNTGTTEQRVIRVEMKKDAPSAALITGVPDPLDSLVACKDTQSLIFENQYVRVIREHVPPGVAQPKHRHRHGILVPLANADIESADDPNGQPVQRQLKLGDAGWREPVIHTVRNVGKTELLNIRIEVK